MEKHTFTVIDIETMTPERTSACALGLVRVENDVIVQKFYSLIKPIPDDRTVTNTHVHGITPEMVENAPTFQDLWPTIEHYISGQVLAAHNTSFDLDVLKKVSAHYGITIPITGVVDTFSLTHLSLDETCKVLHVDLGKHHDALCDATACAEIILVLSGVELPRPTESIPHFVKPKEKTLKKETKQPLSPEEVENKETPFFMKRVVLTGNLETFPARETIAKMLKAYGADINTSISKRTDIVIVGKGAGPSKMQKIEELQAQGHNLRVIEEPELLSIMKEFNIEF